MQQIFIKRWLGCLLLLCFYATVQSQTIKKVEYFIDTDPGVGNGTPINLAQNNVIDSTFIFDVSSLTNGLHLIYVRAQDDNLKWSLNYSTAFIKTAGNDSLLSVTQLEYFYDTDPGFGNGINIPFQQAPTIIDTFNFQIPDNGADSRRLYIRAKDSRGQWSLLYDSTISLCQIYKARANFSWIRFSNLYSFIDSSQNNPLHKLLWNFQDLGIDSVSNPQFTFPQGNHFVKLVAGTGCRKDSIVVPLFTGLEKYYPDSALAGGDIFMNFYGGGLDTNVIVTLKKGTVNITPYSKVANFQQFFTGAFDLHTASPGLYDVNLHFPNGYDTTIIGGMNVGSLPTGTINYSPEIKLSILGPEVGRPNTILTQRLVITNIGDMVAKSIPIWIAVPNDVEFAPAPGFKNYQQPDNQLDYQDSIPTEMDLDSLLGEPYQGKLHNFMIPALNAGESFIYSYTLKTPPGEGEVRYVNFWSGKRMFGSPYEWDCIHQVLDDAFNAASLIPVYGCAFGVAGLAVDYVSGMAGVFGYNNDKSFTTGNIFWGFASAAWGCIPGIKTVEEAIKIGANTVKEVNGSKKIIDAHIAVSSSLLGGNPCAEKNDPTKNSRKGARGVAASDPNGIDGPGGYGDNNYITGFGKQGYEVFFENLPTATANAQRVYVADTLDKNKFDLSSFELIGFSIADSFFQIPYQRKEFTTTLDLRPGMNLQLRVNAKLDTTTGILNYSFLSLDPLTRDTLPLSDLRGFLPPAVNNMNGKGSISYVVNYKKNIATYDVVTNKASIIFDNNAPIITNTWANTIDRSAPVGGIVSGTKISDTTVRLSLSGTDAGVGIDKYKIYFSENNKPFTYIGFVTGDTMRFTGSIDSTYGFYATPLDSVNNETVKSPNAEYTVSFSSALGLNLISFTAQKNQNDVLTNWQTTNQVNFDHFEVERSLDGNHFEEAAIVQAASGSGVLSYQYVDLNVVNIFKNNGKLFYRLKMIDKDRTTSYSKVVRVDFDKKYTVELYPNPASNKITIEGISNYQFIRINDVSGRLVYDKKITQGSETINISNLPKGVYIIKLTGKDDVQSLKFLKE